MNLRTFLAMSALLAFTITGQGTQAQRTRTKQANPYGGYAFASRNDGNLRRSRANGRKFDKYGWNNNVSTTFGGSYRSWHKRRFFENRSLLIQWRLYGCDTVGWFSRFPGREQVCYRSVYPGIDLIYGGYSGLSGENFYLAPGADLGNLVLAFDGMDDCSLSDQGDLILRAGGEFVIQKRPYFYQEIHGFRKPISGHYVLQGNGRVGFEASGYDSRYPLIINRR